MVRKRGRKILFPPSLFLFYQNTQMKTGETPLQTACECVTEGKNRLRGDVNNLNCAFLATRFYVIHTNIKPNQTKLPQFRTISDGYWRGVNP